MSAVVDMDAELPRLLNGWTDPSGEPTWLTAARRRAEIRFIEHGLPTRRIESWKYTDLRVLDRLEFGAGAMDIGPAELPEPMVDAVRLVLVDGAFRPDLSDAVDGVCSILEDELTLRRAVEEQPTERDFAMQALNTARLSGGLSLNLSEKNTSKPIEIIYVSTGDVAGHAMISISAERNVKATVLERHIGIGGEAALSNNVAHITVKDGAQLSHIRLQDQPADHYHVATSQVSVGRDAVYDGFTLTTGASLSRNQVTADLVGEGGSVRLNGAYCISGEQHCDTTTVTEHAVPHCTSDQTYIGIIDDSARGVFQGKIHVHPDAQKTDGYQLNRALLLSPKAEIDSKPQLEIYADDVKCSHGATTGQLDETAMFYLRSRGIPKKMAQRLLIRSFLAEALDKISDEAIRDAFVEHADRWMAAR